ncbi:MAG: hypothetical protein BJG00_016585 [Limnothrix sp. CACIAM 69d]|nr:MAG: hypothetical protein BJG00_016585 [Limnothrix sp. CACIAM 69d]
MPYSSFSIAQIKTAFNLEIHDRSHLFRDREPHPPSEILKTLLEENAALAATLSTEKARSELIIAPVLLEVRRLKNYQIGFFSGVNFAVEPELDLVGECDFILTAEPEASIITAPIVTLVEAKNDNMRSGLGQCIAQMLGAWRFNQQEGSPQSTVYGAVSTGTVWRFLQLQETQVLIDLDEYYLPQIDQILGILLSFLELKF